MPDRDIFAGVHAVLYALFRNDETLDPGAMDAEVAWCREQGVHGITVLGLATEGPKLSLAEKIWLIERVARANGGRLPFSVTTAGNSVAEQIEVVRAAEAAGADWLILQPPTVGAYGADVYLDFFARVAAATTLPVALQNAPQYLGRSLSGEDIARLGARAANVVAVKSEEAALGVRRIVELAGSDFHVLGGRGGLEMTDGLRSGCEGFVLAPDIAPVAARIFDLWRAGDEAAAEALYARAVPAITFAMQSLEHLITYGKRMFAAQAGLTVHDRAPFVAPSDFGLSLADRWARHLGRLP